MPDTTVQEAPDAGAAVEPTPATRAQIFAIIGRLVDGGLDAPTNVGTFIVDGPTGPQFSIDCASRADAIAWAVILGNAEYTNSSSEQRRVNFHVPWLGWRVLVSGSDPGPAEVAAAVLTPDAAELPAPSPTLYLTPSRRALLEHVVLRAVRRVYLADGRSVDEDTHSERKVTGVVRDAEITGWVYLEAKRWHTADLVTATAFDVAYWALTDAGQAALDAAQVTA